MLLFDNEKYCFFFLLYIKDEGNNIKYLIYVKLYRTKCL